MLCRDSAAQDEGPVGDMLREKALWELLTLFFVEAPRAVGGVTEVLFCCWLCGWRQRLNTKGEVCVKACCVQRDMMCFTGRFVAFAGAAKPACLTLTLVRGPSAVVGTILVVVREVRHPPCASLYGPWPDLPQCLMPAAGIQPLAGEQRRRAERGTPRIAAARHPGARPYPQLIGASCSVHVESHMHSGVDPRILVRQAST